MTSDRNDRHTPSAATDDERRRAAEADWHREQTDRAIVRGVAARKIREGMADEGGERAPVEGVCRAGAEREMTGGHRANCSAASGREVILVGTPRTETSDAADRLLDGITVALQEFDTETLIAIADYRDSISEDGWMQRVIREYIEVWR